MANIIDENTVNAHVRVDWVKLQQNDKFFWCFFEKFLILLLFMIFIERFIVWKLFYKKKKETIKNSKCGEKNLNFHQFIKRSKKSNICKIQMIKDKSNLFLHRLRQISPNNSRYFLKCIFSLSPWNILKCAKITNIYNCLPKSYNKQQKEFFPTWRVKIKN